MKKKNIRKRRAWRFPNKETVKQALARTRINPHQLSKLLDVSPQTACNWRDGKPVRRVYVPGLKLALAVSDV